MRGNAPRFQDSSHVLDCGWDAVDVLKKCARQYQID